MNYGNTAQFVSTLNGAFSTIFILRKFPVYIQ